MEKLIELLNEFREAEGYKGGLLYGPFGARQGDLNFIFNHTKFPFIKWLVENDRIDLDHLEYKYQDVMYELLESLIIENKSDFLIMFLSIQEQPIRFLCEMLK